MKFWKILKFEIGTIIDNAYTKHLYFNLNIWIYAIINRILNCLMEKIDDEVMTDDCEEKLMEIQYFVMRDWR